MRSDMPESHARRRAALPDIARFVETRHLLSFAESALFVDPEASELAFVVVDDAVTPLGSVVGHPSEEIIRQAVSNVSELLAFQDNIEHVIEALPSWTSERAILHELPGWRTYARTSLRRTARLQEGELGLMDHLGPELFRELKEVEEEGVEITAAFDDEGCPVAFCYPCAETERWWDVSINTVESHRRLGFAQAVAIQLIREQASHGLAPVWGAVESNAASLALAKKLGFEPVDHLWLLNPPQPHMASSP